MLLNYLICKFKKHNFVSVGSCPFTNKKYKNCQRCGVTLLDEKS